MIHYVYSEGLRAFTLRALNLMSEIIAQEMRLEMKQTRFVFEGISYPLQFVTYENHHSYAFFDPGQLRLGLNRRLAYLANQETLKDILRHEMAHYIAWILFGDQIAGHGPEFHTICRQFGWSDQVAKASMPEHEFYAEDSGIRHEAMVAKVKKLLALATSPNAAEAKAAANKANELILKYNMQWLGSEQFRSEQHDRLTYAAAALQGRRITRKERSIYEMLKVFMVEPIFSTGPGTFALEVVGEEHNILLAVHAAQFLNQHLEYLWKLEKKHDPSLRGVRARHSFFAGVAHGFCQRHQESQREMVQQEPGLEQALVLIKNNLRRHMDCAYPRVRKTHSNGRELDPYVVALGVLAGKDLTIHPTVSNSGSATHYLT